MPRFIHKFPIEKNEISKAILSNKVNLKKIIKIIHIEVRKKMNIFLKKNKSRKIVILDIPLLLENKIDNKIDILIFVKSKKKDILKRLRKRKNFNYLLFKKFRELQLPLDYKMQRSHFIVNNDFKAETIKAYVKILKKKIIKND